MNPLDKYQEDFKQPLISLMTFLDWLNVKLYDQDKSWFQRNWRFFYIVPLLIGHSVAMFVNIIEGIIHGEIAFEDAFMVPIYFINIQTVIKIFILLQNKRKFETLIQNLGELWRIYNLNDIQKSIKKRNAEELRVGKYVFMWIPILVAYAYMVVPIVQTLVLNYILGEDGELRLPFSCSYGFDPTSNFFIYGVIYIYQSYCMLSISYAFLGADFLFITLCAHLSTEFKLLTEDLMHIKPTNVADNGTTYIVYDNRSIRNFVRMHQVYIRLATDMDDATNKITFVNFACTTITLSFFGLTVLSTRNLMDKLMNFTVLVTVVLLTLSQCYYCEKLKTASEEIFNAACENPWYEGNLEYKNIIHLIMIRSQNPCYLKSLYSPITLRTFTKVMSTTWSYFSLMNTVYQNNE